jgi:hypothetical protein
MAGVSGASALLLLHRARASIATAAATHGACEDLKLDEQGFAMNDSNVNGQSNSKLLKIAVHYEKAVTLLTLSRR